MVALNSEHNLLFVIVAQTQREFSRCAAELPESYQATAIWCDPVQKSRAEIINAHSETWLFFLDHDCALPLPAIDEARAIITRNPEVRSGIVCTGRYLNPARARLLQRFQNFVANTWLESSYRSAQPFVLGGVFLVYKNHSANLKTPAANFWGAEDKLLSYAMADAGMKFIDAPQLQVVHHTSSSWRHFFRRAYLHGVHDAQYIGKKNEVSYRFWICKIGVANLNLLPLIALHFCIQRAAILIQKARR